MTYPTEMTLTTGTVAYAADPDSDERIVSREVRVSVTFQIEDEDVDLADLAFAKAAEVERARLAACDRINRNHAGREDPLFDPGDPPLEPPDDDYGKPDENYGSRDENYGNHEDENGGSVHGAVPVAPGCVQSGGHVGNGVSAVSPSAPPWEPPSGADAAAEETDWATRPQVLALGSHFKRLGIGPADQTALLRARFGKFRAERLTRDEAAQLMRSLERGEVTAERGEADPGPAGPIGDADGRRLTATPV